MQLEWFFMFKMWEEIWTSLKIHFTGLNFAVTSVLTLSDEKRLIKHLLENYEKVGINGRPVYNVSETVTVKLGVALVKLLEMNVAEGTGTFSVWLRYVSTINYPFFSIPNTLKKKANSHSPLHMLHWQQTIFMTQLTWLNLAYYCTTILHLIMY